VIIPGKADVHRRGADCWGCHWRAVFWWWLPSPWARAHDTKTKLIFAASLLIRREMAKGPGGTIHLHWRHCKHLIVSTAGPIASFMSGRGIWWLLPAGVRLSSEVSSWWIFL